jgi:hypothetical protein
MHRNVSILFCLLAACGGSSEPSRGSLLAADLGAAPDREVEEEPGPDGLVLRLIDRGDAPHRLLRYERRLTSSEVARVQMMMTVAAASADGRQGGTQTAPVGIDFEVGPAEAVDGGLHRVRIRAIDVEVGLPADTPPDVVAQMNRETEPLRHIDTTLVVDDRGIVHETSGTPPEGLRPETRNLLANIRMSLLSPVLPTPAIGEGAIWEVKHAVDHGDFQVNQIVSYELVSFEEHTGRLQVSMRQHAPPGALSNGETLEHFSTIGGGYVEYDLRHLVPEAQITTRTHVEGELRNAEALLTPTESEMSVAVRVEPVR